MTGLDVEAVLRDHAEWEQRYDDERSTADAAFWRTVCSCGALLPRGGFSDETHRAHVAAVLREHIAEWLNSEAATVWSGADTWQTLTALAAKANPCRASLAATEGDRQPDFGCPECSVAGGHYPTCSTRVTSK